MTTDDVVRAYGDAWLCTDDDERLALLDRAWSDDAVYGDPLAEVVGREALSRHIAGTQASLDGGRISVVTAPVCHHDSAFFRWEMTSAEGESVMTGFDVVQLAPDGRIARLTGFFDADTGR